MGKGLHGRCSPPVAAAYGESALILARQAVAGGPFDPPGARADLRAHSRRLPGQWGWPERYVRSRHRTIITSEGSRGVHVRHSAPAGSPPAADESTGTEAATVAPAAGTRVRKVTAARTWAMIAKRTWPTTTDTIP
ncbi:hypothetical protein GCM10020001_113770 [Nonomuraea salmonea]